jgi:hypothetical protein
MFLVALVLCAPAYAQSADAPLIALDREPLREDPCAAKSGDVVLTGEAAKALDVRLSRAEAEVKSYKATPALPVWAVIVVGVVAAAAGVGITVGIYEAGKARP